jgi:hypothetical protein
VKMIIIVCNIDIAVPNSHNITQTYNTKINKYLELSVAMIIIFDGVISRLMVMSIPFMIIVLC